jgi:hypothetical protein
VKPTAFWGDADERFTLPPSIRPPEKWEKEEFMDFNQIIFSDSLLSL